MAVMAVMTPVVVVSPLVTPRSIFDVRVTQRKAEEKQEEAVRLANKTQFETFVSQVPGWLEEVCKEVNAALRAIPKEYLKHIPYKQAKVEEMQRPYMDITEGYALLLIKHEATPEDLYSDRMHFWFNGSHSTKLTWSWSVHSYQKNPDTGRKTMSHMGLGGIGGDASIKDLTREAVRGPCLELLSYQCHVSLEEVSKKRKRK